MTRSNIETQAKQNIDEIIGTSAFNKMYIATSHKKQLQKLSIRALNDLPYKAAQHRPLERECKALNVL